jgi:hypothetical protein
MTQYRSRHQLSSSSSFLTSSKIVFSNWKYLSLALIIAVAFWLVSSISYQLVFFSPSLAFYWPLPSSSIVPFVLSTTIACLIGVVVSMNMHAYISRNSVRKNKEKEKNKNMLILDGSSTSSSHRHHRFSSILLSGSSIGVISCACTGCSSPIGSLFALSILGGSSGIMGASLFSSFLLMYQIPLQLASIGLLAWSYYYSASKIQVDPASNSSTARSCTLDCKDNHDNRSAVDSLTE